MVRGDQGRLRVIRGSQGYVRVSGRSPGLRGAVELLHSPLLKIRCPHRLKFFDLLLGVDQVAGRFPGGVVQWVSFLLNEVLWHFSQDSLVQDGFNLVFFLVVWGDDGWWRHRASKFSG